jgi:hypothetical protein
MDTEGAYRYLLSFVETIDYFRLHVRHCVQSYQSVQKQDYWLSMTTLNGSIK